MVDDRAIELHGTYNPYPDGGIYIYKYYLSVALHMYIQVRTWTLLIEIYPRSTAWGESTTDIVQCIHTCGGIIHLDGYLSSPYLSDIYIEYQGGQSLVSTAPYVSTATYGVAMTTCYRRMHVNSHADIHSIHKFIGRMEVCVHVCMASTLVRAKYWRYTWGTMHN